MDGQQAGSAPIRHAWQCPECGRAVPARVDVCRCGLERTRLEAAGYAFHTPVTPAGAAAPAAGPPRTFGYVGRLVGCRSSADLGRRWQLVVGVTFVASAAVAVAMVRYTHGPLPATRENVRVAARLDEYTRSGAANAPNTIPSFLALPGVTGVLSADGDAEDPVRSLDESELRRAFCSRSVARQVRFQYPGFYDRWSDARLERTVLQKYPEYRDRVCVLSSRLDADAADIVKYDVNPRSFVGVVGLWMRTLMVTALFALACLNAFFRLLPLRLR